MVHEGQFRTNLSASSTGSNSSVFTEMESLANFSKLLITWFFHQIRNLQRRVSNRNPKRKSKWFPPRKLRRRRWRTEGEPYISHDVLLMATVRATLLPLKLGPPSIFFYNFLPHEKVQLHFKLRRTQQDCGQTCDLGTLCSAKNLDLLLAKTHKQSTVKVQSSRAQCCKTFAS